MAIGLPPQADDRAATSEPGAGAVGAPERVFYRVDYRNVTFAEYWNENPKGIVAHGIRRLFRLRLLGASTDDPCVESLAPFEVPRSAIPGMIAQRLSVPMSQLSALGFRDPIWHAIEDDVQLTTTYLATLTHDSGRMWARVHNRIWRVRTPATSAVFCEIVSELAGGRFVWSLNTKQDLAPPPECTMVRVISATPNQLLAAHQSALAESGAGKPQPIHSSQDLRGSVERHHAVVRDFHVTRGVFAPLTTDDRDSAVKFRDSVQSANDVGSRYPEILAEIEKLQNRKASRTNGLVLLVASIVMFFGAGLTKMGSMKFSADFLLILMGVLFFHETGHWIAMRVFGYRNLKMFFIPFFGAAVTGQHYNVAGWKKVIVSLMGPVPGIIVGSALGAAGVMLHNALLVKIALIAVVMNGFNLLPILPLDGGWVVHAILFSRHHLLELAFRVAALGALFLMAVVTSDPVLTPLAIVMAISLPSMYKLAKITSELRRSPLQLTSVDGQTLPPSAADAIVERIKRVFPARLTNRSAAQYTLQVFESINARPPRALASIGLGALHIGSMLGAVVAAALIYVGMSRGAWHKLDTASTQIVRPQSDSALAEPRNTVFATYGKPSDVRAAVGELKRTTTSETAIASMGDMAVLSLPFEDVDGLRDVQTMFEKRGVPMVISSPTAPAQIRMSCTAKSPAAAKAIDRELGDYFDAGLEHLLPPWQVTAAWSPEQRAQFARARHTLRLLSDEQRSLLSDPRLMDLRMRIYKARRADERAAATRLTQDMQALSGRLGHEKIQAMRAVRDADTAVVSTFERISNAAFATSRADSASAGDESSTPEALVQLLGTVPLTNGHPAAGALDLSATGTLLVSKQSITLPTLRFDNAFQGPPALARWLLTNGCTDVRLAVAAGMEHGQPQSRSKRAMIPR